MWHSGSEPEISRTTRKPPDQSPALSTLHLPPHVHPETPLPAQTHPSRQVQCTDWTYFLSFSFYLCLFAHTYMPTTTIRTWTLCIHACNIHTDVCMYGAALNTYEMDCMYEQTLKHDVRTSDKKNRNALKCGGILIQHDVTQRGRGPSKCALVCVCTCGWKASDWAEQCDWVRLKVIEAEAQCIVKTERKSSPPTLPPLPLCLKWKTLMKRSRLRRRWWLLAQFVWEGPLSLPALSSHTNTDRDTGTHTHRAPTCSAALPAAMMRKGCSIPPPPPLHRLSQSEAVPQVICSDFCHFRFVSKDLTFSHKHTHTEDDPGAVSIRLI